MASSTEPTPKEYAKRPGTSGIRGHLYETKLLSLIYFRAIHDDNIEEFHLATNVDKVGSFDDICFRAKIKGFDEPVAVFIQAKHRENNSVITLDSKSDLARHFKSYLEIRRKFQPNNEDILFEGTFNETKSLFIIYTTAKGDKTETYEGSVAKHLNALISTGAPGSQPSLKNKDVEHLCKINFDQEMTALARQMAKIIYKEFDDSQMLINDELVLRYHVILAQNVFDVSEDQSEEYRIARFRQDFFAIEEEHLRSFIDELCTEILKRRKSDSFSKPCPANLLSIESLFYRETTDIEALYRQIESLIIYKNGKFEFLDKMSSDYHKLILDKINYTEETKRITVKMAVKNCLPSLEFKVPAWFGNKDLTIKGGDKKVERRLNFLTSTIVGLIKNSEPSNVIVVDECMGKGFLQLNGGIASAVGNLLVYDDTSKLKFNGNYDSLGILAKKLFDKLKGEIVNFNEYKFDVKVTIFPKLTFTNDEYNKEIVRDFLSTLLFYTSQSDEKDVEETLVYEINKIQCEDVQNGEITSDAIFLKYHDDVQKWWMTPTVGKYLTKEGSLYKNAVKCTRGQPLIRVINMMQIIKNKYYTFNEGAVNSIKLGDQPSGTIVVTENSALTVVKLANNLNIKNCVVLDLEYILNLSARDDKTLRTELTNMNDPKTLLVIFDNALITKSSSRRLHEIVNSIKDKNTVIIITDQNSVVFAKQYFSLSDNIIKDERNHLMDLSKESQKSILENTKVIFQGNEVSLDQVVDNESIKCLGGYVLRYVMHTNKYTIGKSISDTNYKEKVFMQRAVRRFKVNTQRNYSKQHKHHEDDLRVREGISFRITTLYSIADDVVLIIGEPGMGKSTLLTHLSLKTKELYPTVWIIRINLLEYSRQFSEWQKHKTVVDTLESIKFMSQVSLSEERSKMNNLDIALEESNGNVYLKNCTGDEWTVFGLKIFLNYYNTKKIIFLFDGFDEICPTYANEVLKLIHVVKNYPRKHKMWITSRSYDKMNSILEFQLGILYKIEPLFHNEQHAYLTQYWDEKEILKALNADQFQNISDFSTFMSQSEEIKMSIKKTDLPVQSKKKEMPFVTVYISLVKYLKLRLQRPRSGVDFESYANTLVALNKLSNYGYVLPFNEFIATPLHLNMIAEYLYNKIRDTNIKPNKWDLHTNIFDIYESFLETKLKRIHFQEKNQNDLYKPDNISVYKRVYEDIVDRHKTLAAYAVYGRYLFDEHKLEQIKEMIYNLKKGEERTGIICNVMNDVPVFVHSTFAEYFAVEYICDLIKSKGSKGDPTFIWHFILNVMFFNCNLHVLAMLDTKINIDTELTACVEENKMVIFKLIMRQSKITKPKHGDIKSSLCEAIRNDLRNLGVLLSSTIENNLCERDLMDFIKIVIETKMLIWAIKMEFEEIIVTIVNLVRRIDESKLVVLFEKNKLNKKIEELSADELIQELHQHVWTRMDIVPDWKNLSELSGQICFI